MTPGELRKQGDVRRQDFLQSASPKDGKKLDPFVLSAMSMRELTLTLQEWAPEIAAQLAELNARLDLTQFPARPSFTCAQCKSVLTVRGQMLGQPSCCGQLMQMAMPARPASHRNANDDAEAGQ